MNFGCKLTTGSFWQRYTYSFRLTHISNDRAFFFSDS